MVFIDDTVADVKGKLGLDEKPEEGHYSLEIIRPDGTSEKCLYILLGLKPRIA